MHFYPPVADTRTLWNSLWAERTETAGVDFRETDQAELVGSFAAAYRSEYEAFPREPDGSPCTFYLNNGEPPSVEAEDLVRILHRVYPQRMHDVQSFRWTCLVNLTLPVYREQTTGPDSR